MPWTNQDPNLHAIFRSLEDRVLKNENAKRFTSPPVDVDPPAGVNGDIWLNTTDNELAYKDSTGVKQTVATAAVVASAVSTKQNTINTLTTSLTASVTMTNANTFYNGPSLSLSPGTWLVTANATIASVANTAQSVTTKLHNGVTTTYASSQGASVVGGTGVIGYVPSTLTALITVATTTTVYFSAASTAAASIIKATPDNNATNATNTAAVMSALQLA